MPQVPRLIDHGVSRIKARLCPHCGYQFDAIGTADGEPGTPGQGDVTICLNCAEWLIFESADLLRKPTPEEQELLTSDPEYEDAREHRNRLLSMKRQGFRVSRKKPASRSRH